MSAPSSLVRSALLALSALLAFTVLAAPAAPASAASSGARYVDRGDLRTFPYGAAARRQDDLSVKYAALPADFRRFVRAGFEAAWERAGAREQCANSPYLRVRSWHRAGFVLGGAGLFPASGEPDSCAEGGYTAIFSERGGSWRQVIGTQEAFTCRQLSYHRVPRSMVDTCTDYRGRQVSY